MSLVFFYYPFFFLSYCVFSCLCFPDQEWSTITAFCIFDGSFSLFFVSDLLTCVQPALFWCAFVVVAVDGTCVYVPMSLFFVGRFFFLFFLSVPICVMLGKKNYKKNSFFFRVYFSGSGLVIRPRCTERPHDSDSLTHVFFFFSFVFVGRAFAVVKCVVLFSTHRKKGKDWGLNRRLSVFMQVQWACSYYRNELFFFFFNACVSVAFTWIDTVGSLFTFALLRSLSHFRSGYMFLFFC